ncbi:DUF2092 domain-containing protein [Micromonospora sp. NPDC049359]|uniref:DUF2092 domain-containing protein n=1 Tax=Micromonospora sp. NPDC049359 TaxID=3364270 RepID=UPI0037AD6ED0
MNDNVESDNAGVELLVAFREDLTGPGTDATDRMRHAILNGTAYRRPAAKRWYLRRPAIAAATAFALAGLATGGVVLGTANRTGQVGGIASSTDGSGSHPSQLGDVTYVSSQTQAALGKADDYVVKVHDTYRGGWIDSWEDRQTGRRRVDIFGGDGRPDSTLVTVVADGKYRGTQISHLERTYFEFVDSPDKATGTVFVPNDAASIRTWLARGKLEIVGQEKVDGRDTVHLRLTAGTAAYTAELWVDSTSFLPYKTVADKSGKVTDRAEVSTFEWLPRTDANLSHFDLTPPAGYAKAGSKATKGGPFTLPEPSDQAPSPTTD